MKLTIFGSDYTHSRVPVSPFGDKTFVFKTVDIPLKDSIKYISSYFVLNRSYNLDSIRIRKTKKDLTPYINKELEFIVLDLDDVETYYAQKKIIYWLKKKDYHVVLGPSRGHNGIDNFRLKGVIEAKGLNNRVSMKSILEEIQKGLFKYCKVDLTATNEAAFQAPTFKDEILLYHEGKYIPEARLIEEVKDLKVSMTDDKVLDVCIEHFRSNGFSISSFNEEKELFSFQHPSEKTKNGYFLFKNNPFFMHHFNSSRSFNIFNEVKENPFVKAYVEKYHKEKRSEELVGNGDSNFTVNVNKRYLSVDKNVSGIIDKWFEEKGIMKIKSAMGTGKSNVIAEIIKKAHHEDKPVLMVTNRISVAKDFKKKYKIKLYSEGDYKIGDSLVVQLESLWKYSLRDFEVVVLDEFMSLMIHSRNTMSDYSNLNKVKLQFSLKNKLCVIADAFLYGDEDGFNTVKPKFLINNTFREDIDIIEYPDKDSFTQTIVNTCLEERGKRRKVSISCTSKIMAEVLMYILESEGLKVMGLTSDTNDVDKELIFKEFEKEGHNSWNVLVYTPTLTVGVSNLNKCKHHFHYDEGNTADVISSIQMIRRSRKADTIHLFLNERKRYLETDYSIMNTEIQNNITKYYKQTNNSLLIGINDYGDFELSDTGKFVNRVEVIYNKLENDHKDSFKLLLTHQIKNIPRISRVLNSNYNLSDIKTKLKEEEKQKLLKTLSQLGEVEYSDGMLELYSQRNYIVNEKDKILKVMSEVKNHFRENISESELARITKIEIESDFKYIKKLKKLFLFQSRNEQNLRKLVSYIVSEDIVNKTQVKNFNYMISLKSKEVNLKQSFTMKDIHRVNDIVGWGKFQEFLGKIGYKKIRGKYLLSDDLIQDAKLIKND